jgi:hypothetical protein
MTKADYRQYVRDFDAFFSREGVEHMSSAPVKCPDCDVVLECSECPKCGKDGGEIPVEPYFSWRRCECCGSTLGGNREDYVAWNMGDGRESKSASVTTEFTGHPHQSGESLPSPTTNDSNSQDDDKWIHVSICEDCVYFNEYGRLPDMVMLEVDADRPKCRLKDGRVGICIDFPTNDTAVVSTDAETVTVPWGDVILEGEDGWEE